MSEALPAAEILHAMPGRTRLRFVARRGDAAFLASVATSLAAIPDVSGVEVRPLTGGVLIHHDAPLASIVAAAENARLFVLVEAAPTETLKWPELPINPRMAAAAGLGLLALWQMFDGRVLPPALTIAWYAARLSGLRSGGAAPGGS